MGLCVAIFAVLAPPDRQVPGPGGLLPAMWVNKRAELAFALAAVIALAVPATLLLGLVLPAGRANERRRQRTRRRPGSTRWRRARVQRLVALGLVWSLYVWVMVTAFGPAVETVTQVLWDWKIAPEIGQ